MESRPAAVLCFACCSYVKKKMMLIERKCLVTDAHSLQHYLNQRAHPDRPIRGCK